MARKNIGTQLLDGQEWSKHLRWTVTMHTDHRGNVLRAHALCTYGHNADAPAGYAQVAVGPFDILSDVLRFLMIEAATTLSEQLVLPGF